MRVLGSPLVLGMQGGPLVPPAQQWGVWTCLTSRWAARRACVSCWPSKTQTRNWLVPLPLGPPFSVIDLRRMDAVDSY